jgi:aminocarboxymuconate-semialdehyde decarboxylase
MTAHGACIDMHGHGVPRPFADWARATGFGGVEVGLADGLYRFSFPGSSPLRPMNAGLPDFEERLAWMDARSISHQIVAPWMDIGGQELPSAAGVEWTRRLNDCMAEAVQAAAGRLRAYATVHLADPKAAAGELERAVRELGMAGCMIPTELPGGDLADGVYGEFFAAAEELRAPVVLHPLAAGPSSCIPGMDRWASIYGRLIDTTMAAARLIAAGVLDRHPAVNIGLVHGGGMLPYQFGRLTGNLLGALAGKELKERTPETYLRRFFYDTVLMRPEAVSLMVQLAGADRVLIGSDYPFCDKSASVSQAVDEAVSSEQDRAAVFTGNAARLFAITGAGYERLT